MKKRTEKLLDQVDKSHDWLDGQVYGHGGTQYSSTDTCQVCNLDRRYSSDSQNGVEGHYTFEVDGEPISLLAASEIECC